jgi:hypothetical protein
MKCDVDGEPVIKFSSTPLCANSIREYKIWLKLNKPDPAKYGFCTDCSSKYQAEMVAQQRCKYPGVRFDVEGNGYYVPLPFNEVGSKYLTDEELQALTGHELTRSVRAVLRNIGIPYHSLAGRIFVHREVAIRGHRQLYKNKMDKKCEDKMGKEW